MNTVLMPVGMAMLASRLWDVEAKGNMPKLLYTLQSRRSLFAAKVLLGMAELFLIVSVETVGVWALGQWLGYLDTPPLIQLSYSFLCTYTVNLMLFFSELLLTILLNTPLPALCTGIAGALIGLFSAFMPPIVGYFVPWGYFIPLTTYVLVDWDPDTRAVVYGIREFRPFLLLWCAVLALFFFCITWQFRHPQRELVRALDSAHPVLFSFLFSRLGRHLRFLPLAVGTSGPQLESDHGGTRSAFFPLLGQVSRGGQIGGFDPVLDLFAVLSVWQGLCSPARMAAHSTVCLFIAWCPWWVERDRFAVTFVHADPQLCGSNLYRAVRRHPRDVGSQPRYWIVLALRLDAVRHELQQERGHVGR